MRSVFPIEKHAKPGGNSRLSYQVRNCLHSRLERTVEVAATSDGGRRFFLRLVTGGKKPQNTAGMMPAATDAATKMHKKAPFP